jgi:hypothetical protein
MKVIYATFASHVSFSFIVRLARSWNVPADGETIRFYLLHVEFIFHDDIAGNARAC